MVCTVLSRAGSSALTRATPRASRSLRDMADELDAIHAGHVQVDQDHVGRMRLLFQHGQRGGAIGGFQRVLDPEFGQQPQRHAALEPVVFHDHHVQGRQGHPFSPVNACREGQAYSTSRDAE